MCKYFGFLIHYSQKVLQMSTKAFDAMSTKGILLKQFIKKENHFQRKIKLPHFSTLKHPRTL